MWETLFDLIPFRVYVVDVESFELVYLNRCMRAARGAPTGRTCWQVIYGLDDRCEFCAIPALLDAVGGPTGDEVILEQFHEDEDCWLQLHERAMVWHDGRVVKYSIGVDISGTKEIQNRLAEAHAELALRTHELEELSASDRLTGLCNRLKLDEVLSQAFERACRQADSLAIILIDLDDFKRINDTFGHQVGDTVLIAIAERFAATVRRQDTLGRWGGEEFMVVCPGTDQAAAQALAERLRHAIAVHDFGHGERLTCSIGVATHRDGDTSAEMIRRADRALYEAKGAGRNRVRTA